ncbi:MAG: AbrB/MazE/SpoVT family DNA-binding domain-containing protein [Vitreoscilla sp.]|nr:AbrB/MazE/SpoVT family DNA-binding domain-containing protein [Polaromonas sp.]
MSVATATLSSKYQISIPKDIREAMNFKPGEQLAFLRVGKSLRLVRVRKMEDFIGMTKGANTDDYRDRSTRREDNLPVPTAAQKVAMQKRFAKKHAQDKS